MKEELSGIPSGDFFSLKDFFFFLFLSLLLHFLIAFSIYFYSIKEQRFEPPFFARVITPEEIKGLLSDDRFKGKGLGQNRSKVKDAGIEDNNLQPNNGIRPDTRPLTDSSTVEKGPEDFIRLPDSSGSSPTIKGSTSIIPPLAKLFDREVIREQAGKESKEKPPEVTFDTKEFKYHGYMNRLKEKIESIWQYPRTAAERGIYGDLYIRFSIKKDGTLGRVDLVRTSGYRELDDAALRALYEGAPYWPLPQEWGLDEFVIEGHFIYTLYGYYIK